VCSLYNHPRGSTGSRSITRECRRSALAWKEVASPVASSGGFPHYSVRRRRRGAEERKGLDSAGRWAPSHGALSARPRLGMRVPTDTRARARHEMETQIANSPFSLLSLSLSLLFLVAGVSRESRNFSLSLFLVDRLLRSPPPSTLLLISLYLLTSAMVEKEKGGESERFIY